MDPRPGLTPDNSHNNICRLSKIILLTICKHTNAPFQKYTKLFTFSFIYLTLQVEGGLLKPALNKKEFLEPFCDLNDTKKFDFSQISMTMPPILFWGLEMAKKGVSIALLSSAGPKFGSENAVFWPF